jgi:DNA-binding transcriptional LysR family regulator
VKIDHIRTFLEISDCGNFNRAAENLNVTQSTVSARVKAMEERFGRILFTRGHAGVELTSAGQHFRQYALNIQRLWQQAQQQISLPENFSHGIGLGSQVSLWDSLILKWIPWMRRNANDVAIHVEADYSPSLMRQLSDGLLDIGGQLSDGLLDIGVMYNPRRTPGLVIEDLLDESLVLVATDQRDMIDGWVEDYVFGLGQGVSHTPCRGFPGHGYARSCGWPRCARARVYSTKWWFGLFPTARGATLYR